MTEPLLTAAEAATLLSPSGAVSERTIADAMRSGALANAKLGRTRFTTESDLTAWVRQCRAKNSRPASTSDAPAPTATPSGSSKTAEKSTGQAALKATA
ncbi:MAG: helix-turn-helix domain-containing protein, partial [Pseudomonadota bacterium]